MKTFFAILTVAILSWSCDGNIFNQKDYEIKSIEATPTEALPLAFGDLSIADVLSNKDSAFIKVYPDGLVYLNYDQVLKSQGVRDLIVIHDKSTNLSITTAISYPGSNSDVPVPFPLGTAFSFDLTPALLTEILLKSGTLSCDLGTSNINCAVKIDIPEFEKAGTPLSFTTTGLSSSFSLGNYLFSNTPIKANTITLNLTLIIKPHTNTIPAGTTINPTISFKGLDYKYVKGFFGDRPLPDLPAETLNIQAFGTSSLNGAKVSFANPKIVFNAINEVGVPTKINFNVVEARKPGSSLPIQISPSSTALIYPFVMGQSATTPFTVNKVDSLFNFAPTQIYYKVSGSINEGLDASSGYNNFVTDTSKLKVSMHVEVPLYGRASNIKLADTLSYDLSDADQSQILSAALKIKTTNQIPLSANVQFYLTDDNYKVLDSLLSPDKTNIIKGSTVNASGELATAGVVDEIVTLSKDKLDKLFQAKKIIIRGKLNTSQDANGTYPDVKFKSTYKMNIKLGLQVNGKIKVDL